MNRVATRRSTDGVTSPSSTLATSGKKASSGPSEVRTGRLFICRRLDPNGIRPGSSVSSARLTCCSRSQRARRQPGLRSRPVLRSRRARSSASRRSGLSDGRTGRNAGRRRARKPARKRARRQPVHRPARRQPGRRLFRRPERSASRRSGPSAERTDRNAGRRRAHKRAHKRARKQPVHKPEHKLPVLRSRPVRRRARSISQRSGPSAEQTDRNAACSRCRKRARKQPERKRARRQPERKRPARNSPTSGQTDRLGRWKR